MTPTPTPDKIDSNREHKKFSILKTKLHIYMYGDKKTKHDRINREPQVLELKKWQLWALTILVVIALLGAGHFDFQAVQMGLI